MRILKVAIAGVALVLPLRLIDAYTAGGAEGGLVSAARAGDAAPAAAPAPEGGEAPPGPSCETPEAAAALIRAERAALDERARKADEAEARAELATARLEVEMRRLADLKAQVSALLDQAQGRNDADLARLVAMYEAMKPKEAAGILDAMDLSSAVHILAAMGERKAAPVVARMDPVRAQAVTAAILDRGRMPGDKAR